MASLGLPGRAVHQNQAAYYTGRDPCRRANFAGCDLISLLVQGIGIGGSISSGARKFQSQADLVFGVLTSLSGVPPSNQLGEVLRGTTDRRLNRMLHAMFVMMVFIVISCAFTRFLHVTHPSIAGRSTGSSNSSVGGMSL